MELVEIKVLLEKYYEATTSLDEEKTLRRFLKDYHGNDSQLVEAKQMFLFFGKESEDAVTIDFESVINKETSSKTRRLYGFASAIAASLIIGLSLLFLLKTSNPPVIYAYVNGQAITDKEQAIQYSKQALSTISTNLNKGTSGLNYMNKMNKPLELLTIKKQ